MAKGQDPKLREREMQEGHQTKAPSYLMLRVSVQMLCIR